MTGVSVNEKRKKIYRSPEYTAWYRIKSGCCDPQTKYFKSYGARGCTISPRWKIFGNFIADMGERPPGMVLGCKDFKKEFSAENCAWMPQTNTHPNHRADYVDKMIGKIITSWRVISLVERHKYRRYYLCECTSCGFKKIFKYGWLLGKKCEKCLQCKINEVIGFLSKDWRVISFHKYDKGSHRLYRCKCDRCGNEKIFQWHKLCEEEVSHCTVCWRWRGRYGWELR